MGSPPLPSPDAVKPLGPLRFELVAIAEKRTGVIIEAHLSLQSGYNGLQLVEGAKSGRLKQDWTRTGGTLEAEHAGGGGRAGLAEAGRVLGSDATGVVAR